jgi:hypothetical protein
LAESLGVVIAELRAEWEHEKAVIIAETRAAIAEVKNAALELLLERHDTEAVARLRAIEGGRR